MVRPGEKLSSAADNKCLEGCQIEFFFFDFTFEKCKVFFKRSSVFYILGRFLAKALRVNKNCQEKICSSETTINHSCIKLTQTT